MAANTHSVLTLSTIVIGNIYADEDLRLDGKIEGNVTCKGKIVIGPQSQIKGDIECENIEIYGQIAGSITCRNLAVLRAACDITGNIKTQIIEVESGAKLDGACSMLETEQLV